MAQTPETHLSQPTKTLQNHTPKPQILFSYTMKAFIAICIVASVSLICYSTFWSHHSGFPESPNRSIVNLNHIATELIHEETNVSHVLFGIGGSAKTWSKRRHYSELWWKNGITRGFVWLDEKPAANVTWPDMSPPYKVSEDTSRFKYTSAYGSRSAVRIARIVKESFQLGLDNVRWFVMGDDDTVFFVENLVTVLGKYDHNEMYYIGGNSESVEQDVIHSYTMAYGGGGFAISYPLAAELVRVLDGCIDRYASFYGSDQKIGGCMSEIGVPVTKELGFHQAVFLSFSSHISSYISFNKKLLLIMIDVLDKFCFGCRNLGMDSGVVGMNHGEVEVVDIRGDPYGLLAAHPVAPLVSLHHLDYVQPVFPGLTRIDSLKKLVQAYKLDPGRTLQHTSCYDPSSKWSLSVSWGYTAQLYPSLITAKDLATAFQTFFTWRSWSEGPFAFNTRLMSDDPCQRPAIYFLDRVHGIGSGQTVTTYKRFWAGGGNECGFQEYGSGLPVRYVNVTAAELEPDTWKKAPQRQCCEIINGASASTDAANEDVVQVRIRSCHRWESVTPP
ncbi:hypothetical protein RHSIM_Rhsim05G0195700 [Rhododendron simsii]|uniref:Uncharacterized protein n=1 Tax=Rhododendron simsii TaxID=118357 RepID=A0A834GW94_RHOSS|nr:hypothetical protein RHSIM_Rhsim05G0195700 [Rhododendron simsii]